MPSSDEEGGRSPEGEKAEILYDVSKIRTKLQAFLSLTLRELPRQREPLNCKLLLLNLIDEVDTFTHNSSLITHHSDRYRNLTADVGNYPLSTVNCPLDFSVGLL